jgi:hypothetical protein
MLLIFVYVYATKLRGNCDSRIFYILFKMLLKCFSFPFTYN